MPTDTPALLLHIPPAPQRRPAIAWLLLGVGALIAAGLFSLLLVLSRTPAIQEIIPWTDFFHTALVVHVDLSVLIWFMAFAALFWSLATPGRLTGLEWTAYGLAVAGTLALIASPFSGEGHPLMNNYIPVLQLPLFRYGLGLFAAGICLQVMRAILWRSTTSETREQKTLQRPIRAAAYVTLLAAICLYLSYRAVDPAMEAQAYFEWLFWGGGHVLQFTHAVLMLLTWVVLLEASGGRLPIKHGLLDPLFALVTLPALIAVPIYFTADVVSAEHRLGFTQLMQYGGLAAVPLGGLVLLGVLRRPIAPCPEPATRAALIASIALFAAGGVLGFLIEGVNVVIPAHYHGSIVGVTLAYMGLSYHLLPRLGFRAPMPRLARLQPYIYGGGQLLHILGLAWSGGYGVQRKTAGAAQGLDSLEKVVGMGMMGLGGLIAVIGGTLFLVVMLTAMWPRNAR